MMAVGLSEEAREAARAVEAREAAMATEKEEARVEEKAVAARAAKVMEAATAEGAHLARARAHNARNSRGFLELHDRVAAARARGARSTPRKSSALPLGTRFAAIRRGHLRGEQGHEKAAPEHTHVVCEHGSCCAPKERKRAGGSRIHQLSCAAELPIVDPGLRALRLGSRRDGW
jgi:hypothetical protein